MSSERSRANGPTPTHTPASDTTIVSAPDGRFTEVEPKSGGIYRITTERTADCTCADCGMVFASAGTAASHSRSKQHVVRVDYRASFSFVPLASLPKAWIQ